MKQSIALLLSNNSPIVSSAYEVGITIDNTLAYWLNNNNKTTVSLSIMQWWDNMINKIELFSFYTIKHTYLTFIPVWIIFPVYVFIYKFTVVFSLKQLY